MCTETLAQIVLIIINAVFFLGGGVTLAVGIIAYVRGDLLLNLTALLTEKLGSDVDNLGVLTSVDIDGIIQSNAIILIVIGAILFGIGFFGCCGAWKKNSVCLTAYAIIIVVILATEVGLIVYAYMFSDKIEEQIKKGLVTSMDKYYVTGVRFKGDELEMPNDATELSVDAAQFATQCCGVNGYEDWASFDNWDKLYTYGGQEFTASLPPSCCKRTETSLGNTDIMNLTQSDFVDLPGCVMSATDGSYSTEGCFITIRDIVFEKSKIVTLVFIIIILVEIMALFAACWIRNNIKE